MSHIKSTKSGASTGDSSNDDHERSSIQRPLNSYNVLTMLWDKAQPHLTPSELSFVSGASDHACQIAGFAATVADGLAFLLSFDDPENTKSAPCGNFRTTRDLPDLLWYLAETFRQIDGLVTVGSQAEYDLHKLDAARAADIQGGAA